MLESSRSTKISLSALVVVFGAIVALMGAILVTTNTGTVLAQVGDVCQIDRVGETPGFCSGDNMDDSNGGINDDNSVIEVLGDVINILLIIAAIASVLVVLIGSFMMISGSGDPNSVKTARQAVIYALIGLAVSILARSIIALALDRFLN